MSEILNTVIAYLAYYGATCVGAYCAFTMFLFIWGEALYLHGKLQIHKGAVFVREKDSDNPFKEPRRRFVEILDRQGGYVLFKAEGEEISITMREFLRIFRVWYGEYNDRED